MTEDIKKVF